MVTGGLCGLRLQSRGLPNARTLFKRCANGFQYHPAEAHLGGEVRRRERLRVGDDEVE